MLDGLSLVASVITLTGVVVEAVKCVRTLSRASLELGELQEQVEQLAHVLQEIDNQKVAPPSNIATTLGKAKATLEHLKTLLETKIISKSNNSSRIRRRAWARSRSKVYRIQSSLKEYRTNLIVALTASSSSSAARSEAALTSLSREVGCSETSSTSLHTQLSNLQESILRTHDAVISQTTMVNSVLQSVSAGSRNQLCGPDERSSVLGATGSGEWSNQYTKHKIISRHSTSPNCVASRPSSSSKPVTPYEASQNFFPESYTIDAQVPISCLMVIGSSQQLIQTDSRTSVYRLLFLNSFRHWHWLTIAIQIPCFSMYWVATESTHRERAGVSHLPSVRMSALLPYSLLKKIQAYICQEEILHDNTKMSLWLSDRETIKGRPHISYFGAPESLNQPLSSSSDALAYLHDLGCRRYDESEVVQIQLVEQPTCFYSSLNGKLVYEIKSISPTPAIDFLYAVRDLHCMNGTPGFTRLIGIVTDDTQKYLKSYLLEHSAARSSCLLQAAACPGIPWERRERWAIQLIKAISQSHAQSFVVGGLTTLTVPFINSSDSVQLYSFKERFVTGRMIGAYYPPEFRHIRNMSPTVGEADCPHVTIKTDIFHLGLLLWLLAENKPATREGPVCRRVGCNTSLDTGIICDLSHTEPIALPLLPQSIPKYFRDIVDACRREIPSERPAARELLEMFPFPNNPQPGLLEQDNLGTKMTLREIRTKRITCDHCAKSYVQITFFDCNICQVADFDLCQACYDGGKHCHDDSHLLLEMGKIGSWHVPKRYHSCVKSSGVRDFIDL